MQARSHAVPAEQHDPEETGLEEERGEHLVGQQRAGDGPGEVGEMAPVGAELVRHDQPGHHAHAEIDRENLRPEMIEVAVDLFVRFQPEAFQYGQVAGQPDGDRREDDVEGHGERELDAGKVDSLQSEHGNSSSGSRPFRLTCGFGRASSRATLRKVLEHILQLSFLSLESDRSPGWQECGKGRKQIPGPPALMQSNSVRKSYPLA